MKQHQLSFAIAIAALLCCAHSETFSQTDWHITGNSGTNATTNFVGTIDNQGLSVRTNNAIRMRISSTGNIGIATISPVQKLDVNGNINIGKGFGLYMENQQVLKIDPVKLNIFIGNQAGLNNTSGFLNTASGYQALFANQTGSYNTAYGVSALANNVAGENIAYGVNALYRNTTGTKNTGIGNGSLSNNSTGGLNTAVG